MSALHPDRLDLEQFSDVPLFNTKAVVQHTGITAPTLRAWERRYMILSPERAQNDYRLYSERDIATIRWLKAQIDAGMSISQAIALFRHLERQEKGQTPGISLADRQKTQPDGETTVTATRKTSNMQSIQDRLLTCFNEFDEARASQLMHEVLATSTVEHMCAELIAPVLWEVGQRWESGSITVSVEHFASNFFQNLLANMFHSTPASNTTPLVIVCCAPGEAHAIAPLMLSLLLRRAGVRVVYLGQSIEIAGLLQTIQQLSPAILCLSVTIHTYIAGVIEIGHKLQKLPSPRPTYIIGGQAFEQYTAIIEQVAGIYLNGELETAIAQIKQLVLQEAI